MADVPLFGGGGVGGGPQKRDGKNMSKFEVQSHVGLFFGGVLVDI